MPRFVDWSRFIPILWLMFSFAAEAQPFKGDCTDSVLLGSEGWPELERTLRAVREQLKAGEVETAIALHRKVVGMQCHNPSIV